MDFSLIILKTAPSATAEMPRSGELLVITARRQDFQDVRLRHLNSEILVHSFAESKMKEIKPSPVFLCVSASLQLFLCVHPRNLRPTTIVSLCLSASVALPNRI